MEYERNRGSSKHATEQAALTPAEKYKQELRGLFGLERGSMPHDIASSTLLTVALVVPIFAGSFGLVYLADGEPKTSPNNGPSPTPMSEGLKDKASFHIGAEDFLKQA